MKRVFVLLLVVMLALTGCAGRTKAKNVSVKDVCCPYEITHQKGALEVAMKNGTKSSLLWNVEVLPDDVCEVTQEKTEDACRYHIVGIEAGAAELTITAQQEDGTVKFILVLVVNVDSSGNVSATYAEHREREDVSVEKDNLSYTWNVDVDGILNFVFTNNEEIWSISGDGGDVCRLQEALITPSGCRFSAEAVAPGQTSILLVGKETQRTISVVVQVDDGGNMEVISVQEQ